LSKLQPSDRSIVKATTLGPPDYTIDHQATTLRPMRPSDCATWHDLASAYATSRDRCCSKAVAKGFVQATTLGPLDCKSYNPRTARLYHRPPSYNPPSAVTVGSCQVARSRGGSRHVAMTLLLESCSQRVVQATTLGPLDCKSYNPRTARLYHRPPSYNPRSTVTVGSCHVARS
jgi:hypothetical protein